MFCAGLLPSTLMWLCCAESEFHFHRLGQSPQHRPIRKAPRRHLEVCSAASLSVVTFSAHTYVTVACTGISCALNEIAVCRSRIFRGLLPTLSGVMSTAVFVGIYETLRDVSHFTAAHSPHMRCKAVEAFSATRALRELSMALHSVWNSHEGNRSLSQIADPAMYSCTGIVRAKLLDRRLQMGGVILRC